MVRYRHRVASTKRLFAELTRPGPHRVLRGDLGFAGLAGVVYTPAAGYRLPCVAFGHGWLTGVEHYTKLLEHLASWGLVVVAPNTSRGPVPSPLNLAAELNRALDIAGTVRLGPGRISIDPKRLALAGHGLGASAAVLAAAARRTPPRTVAAVFPSATVPPAEDAAADLTVPALILAAPDAATALQSNALALAADWPSATLRVVDKAVATGLPAGRRLAGFFGLPSTDKRTGKRVRALLTGYLLAQLAGDKRYAVFADAAAALPHTAEPGELPAATAEERFVALLK